MSSRLPSLSTTSCIERPVPSCIFYTFPKCKLSDTLDKDPFNACHNLQSIFLRLRRLRRPLFHPRNHFLTINLLQRLSALQHGLIMPRRLLLRHAYNVPQPNNYRLLLVRPGPNSSQDGAFGPPPPHKDELRRDARDDAAAAVELLDQVRDVAGGDGKLEADVGVRVRSLARPNELLFDALEVRKGALIELVPGLEGGVVDGIAFSPSASGRYLVVFATYL